MATYTPAQLKQYFERIRLPKDHLAKYAGNNRRLEHLTLLQQHHLATIPFDSIGLHYSPTRLLSLDSEDLFQKIVVNSRGGYCMEVNALFGNILRSLQFQVVSVGGRVKHKKWSHMINLVTIDGQKYIVDVGFGAKEATQPVPLQDGFQFTVLGSTRGRLNLKHLDKHSAAARHDEAQRLWVYSVQAGANVEWVEMYSFTETEFFPDDFEMMSYFVSTRPDSWFVQEVIAYRMLLGDEGMVGEVTLHQNKLTVRRLGQSDDVSMLSNELQRVEALRQHFDINLTEREQRCIKGLASEIKSRE